MRILTAAISAEKLIKSLATLTSNGKYSKRKYQTGTYYFEVYLPEDAKGEIERKLHGSGFKPEKEISDSETECYSDGVTRAIIQRMLTPNGYTLSIKAFSQS